MNKLLLLPVILLAGCGLFEKEEVVDQARVPVEQAQPERADSLEIISQQGVEIIIPDTGEIVMMQDEVGGEVVAFGEGATAGTARLVPEFVAYLDQGETIVGILSVTRGGSAPDNYLVAIDPTGNGFRSTDSVLLSEGIEVTGLIVGGSTATVEFVPASDTQSTEIDPGQVASVAYAYIDGQWVAQ